MGKYFDTDYNEVEAFSKEELDQKVAEATTAAEEKGKEELEAAQAKLTEKEGEYTNLSKKYDSRKEEYENAKAELEKVKGEASTAGDDKKAAFEKMRDSYLDKAAGDDKEYREELAKQFERIGSETLDPTEIEASMKDAHALAVTSMERDFTPFSMTAASTGEAPKPKSEEGKAFTETESGKATQNAIYQAMGMEVKSEDKKE
jgi:predicted RNase H-like nuclease (RuvC/YqgF family)